MRDTLSEASGFVTRRPELEKVYSGTHICELWASNWHRLTGEC